MSVARSSLLLLRRPPAVRQMKPPPSLPPLYLAFVESEGDVKYDLCCPTIVINAVPFGFEIAVRSHPAGGGWGGFPPFLAIRQLNIFLFLFKMLERFLYRRQKIWTTTLITFQGLNISNQHKAPRTYTDFLLLFSRSGYERYYSRSTIFKLNMPTNTELRAYDRNTE